MAEKKKSKSRHGLLLADNTMDRLQEIAEQRDISRNQLVRDILDNYVKNFKNAK